MPSSARKSSLGAARRGPHKAHIPYRGDNPEVGKKTGIAVQHVERKSDGFEPFEEIMQQADKRTPPKPKRRKKKPSLAVPVEIDENGEMSMELDDSPLQYVAPSRPLTTPSNRNRTSSLRPVSRTSDINFDEIPSPRRNESVRKSLGHPSRPGPSRLSQSYNAQDDEPDRLGNNGYGASPVQFSSQHTRLTQLDQDDDDDYDLDEGGNNMEQQVDEPERESPSPPPRRDKGKGQARHIPVEPESDVEEEIREGVEIVEEGQYSDDDGGAAGDDGLEPAEPEPQHRKKAKILIKESKKPHTRTQSTSENRSHREGVRKSSRTHYKPLEWWRGEKLVYGRRDDEDDDKGPLFVAPIREIRRIPREEPEPLGKRRRTTRYRSKSKAAEGAHVNVAPVSNPEEGWDDDTEQHSVVMDYISKEEVERRIAFTAKMIDPKKATDDGWAFQRVFGDADFVAAGILVIPPKGRKPSKGTKDNTYVFYVIEGAVNLKVHETSLILATGAMFMVPRGNAYFIENIADRDAKLFFTQARKIAPEDLDAEPSRPLSVRPVSENNKKPRSSSAGAAVAGGANGRAISKTPTLKRAASTRA